MHTFGVFTFLLAFASAAPSGHRHTRAHRRRERFMTRHVQEISEVLRRENHLNDPIAHSTHTHHTHLIQNKVTNTTNETYTDDADCLLHHPFLKAQTKPVHQAKLHDVRQIDYSGNWCGIVQEQPTSNSSTSSSKSPFIAVSASWTMPTLTAPNNSQGGGGSSDSATFYGSQWVGIDGYTYGGAILQAGTTSAVTVAPNGTAVNSASAWFEWFPDPESPIAETDLAVNPGDEIWCEVRAINATAGTVTILNKSSGENYTQVFSAPSEDAALQGVNAEWIYEDFSAGGLVPFASFTPVTFENCTAETTDGQSVGLTAGTVVDLVDGNDVVCNAAVVDGASLKVAYGPGS